MAREVLRLWLNSALSGSEVPFYVDGFKRFGDKLNIEIELKFFSSNRTVEYLVEAFKNGHGPDVFEMGTTLVRTMAHLDFLDPMPDYIVPRKALAKWMDTCMGYRGKTIGVPWFGDVVVLAARQDVLDRYGIKASDVEYWDGFRKVCERLSASGTDLPLLFRVRPEYQTFYYYISWLWSGGWRFPGLNTIPDKVFDEKAKKTFEYLFGLMENSRITTGDLRVHPQQLFEQFQKQGKYIFYIGNWSGAISGLVRNPSGLYPKDVKYKIMPMPAAGPDKSNWGGGCTLLVSKAAPDKEAAWRLVEYMTSDDFIEEWTAKSGAVPAFECSFWDRNLEDENLKTVKRLIEDSDTFPFHPMWHGIETIISDEIVNLLWSILEGRAPVTRENIGSALLKTDRSIYEFLKLTWEMVS